MDESGSEKREMRNGKRNGKRERSIVRYEQFNKFLVGPGTGKNKAKKKETHEEVEGKVSQSEEFNKSVTKENVK